MSGFLQAGRLPLILASSSKIRARILEAAGLAFIVEPPGLDEGVMRQAVSDLAPKAYVIGADQVLAFGNQIMSKPDSMETARRELLDLSGKSHTLHTSVAVATNGETIWATTEIATLTMRKLSPEFIGRYLAAAGEEVLNSVGAYQIESIGIQLFDRIDGDYLVILGLALIPLLDTLRREGVIEA